MGVMETYNNGLDTITRYTSLLSTNKEKIRRGIVNSLLIVLVLGVFGCLDFMTWTFDFSRIITSEYWTKITTKLVAAICSFNLGINFNWSYAIERAIELKNNIDLYNILIKQKDDANFDYYVNHIFNKHTKRRAYINKINRKIYFLNRISKDSDQALYSKKIPSSAENYEQLVKELEEQKKTNKYCIRRAELEYLKSDEYIKENIDSLGVSYTRVDPSVFDLDINAKSKENVIKVKGNVGIGRARASSSVALSMVVISMLTTALVLSLNQEQFVDQMQAFWYYLLSCIIDAGLVAWNLFRGTRASASIIDDELTKPYAGRNKVLKGYIEWKETEGKQPSASFLKIEQLKKEEEGIIEVEMTEEELNKLKEQTPPPQPSPNQTNLEQEKSTQ
jgi:hypothetical protein